MDRWQHLREGLAGKDHEPDPPQGARLSGALALLYDTADDDLSLLLTRRRDDLPRHPGQISFPGGRVESDETPLQAALREAAEECALDPRTVTVLGRLATCYIRVSDYWMTVSVARWDRPHELEPDPGEVAEVLWVRLSELAQPHRWRCTTLPIWGPQWAWQLDGDALLWGATARATVTLLDLVQPDWHGGIAPGSLPVEQHVAPWQAAEASS